MQRKFQGRCSSSWVHFPRGNPCVSLIIVSYCASRPLSHCARWTAPRHPRRRLTALTTSVPRPIDRRYCFLLLHSGRTLSAKKCPIQIAYEVCSNCWIYSYFRHSTDALEYEWVVPFLGLIKYPPSLGTGCTNKKTLTSPSSN